MKWRDKETTSFPTPSIQRKGNNRRKKHRDRDNHRANEKQKMETKKPLQQNSNI